MKGIIFGTTNKDKLAEARAILGIKVEGISLNIDEIQSPDATKVATKKAMEYWKKIKKPCFVEDTALVFQALNNLPGVYIKDFFENLGNEGLTNLIPRSESREAKAITVLAYFDGKDKPKIFTGETKGTIAIHPKGENGFGWDAIFIPVGAKKTFAEMSAEEKSKYSMRKKALLKLHTWLKDK